MSTIMINKDRIKAAINAFSAPMNSLGSIVLVRPFSIIPLGSYSSPLTHPIGLAYLASTLEAARYSVSIIDGLGEDIFNIRKAPNGKYNIQGMDTDRIIELIPRDARVIGITLMFSQEWVEHRLLIKSIREAFPESIIVIGGEHASALPEYCMTDCPEVDFLITGEGELAFLELISNIYNNKLDFEIAGLFYRRNGKIHKSDAKRIYNITDLPRPAWHLIDVKNYFFDNWTMGISMGRNMPIMATRGCPYQCTFCSSPTMWTTRYIMRGVVDVVDEIEYLIAEYDANSIDFFDLTAIVKKSWVLDFCKELDRRNLHITWQLPSGTRSEALDSETLQAIYDAGCKLVVYAPESGSQNTLNRIKKKLSLKKLVSSVRTAVKIGHTVKINLIIGFPHEKLRDVFSTMFFSFKMAFLGVDDCNVAIFSPYPGSELYDQLRNAKIINEPSNDYFESLMAQFDFTNTSSYCANVPGFALAIIRFFSHMGFYSISYLTHPYRIIRLLNNVFSDRFQASNLFEQRVSDFLARRRHLKNKSILKNV